MAMAFIRGLAHRLRAKTLNPPSPRPRLIIPPPTFLRNGKLEEHRQTYGSGPKEFNKLHLHLALAGGLLGFGVVDVAFADTHTDKAAAITPPPPEAAPETGKSPPESPSDLSDIETAQRERARLEELLRSRGCLTGSYPPFIVKVIGQTVIIRFRVPPSPQTQIPFLMANLVSRLGVKTDAYRIGSHMKLDAYISTGAWRLILTRPKTWKETTEGNNVGEGGFFIQIFQALINPPNDVVIQFWKKKSFTSEELDALATVLQIAGVY